MLDIGKLGEGYRRRQAERTALEAAPVASV